MAPPNSNRWTTDPDCIDLLNYLIKRTENVESPMRIKRIAIEFKEKSGAEQSEDCLTRRIEALRTHIYPSEHIDTNTKVKLMFALGASVDASFLKKMRKEAIVEVDDKKRITHFKANDESLELNGDHSRSAKKRTTWLESKRSYRSVIINYFETKDDADAIPKNKEHKEMGNLIEFVTEKCVNVDTPLSIVQLAKDFNNRFGISIPIDTIRKRVEGYCREIQKLEFLDTHTRIRQLFGLSAKLNSDYLEKLRKDAVVEVDNLNRLTKYTANDGSMTLYGEHSRSAKGKLSWIERKKRRNVVEKLPNSGGDENEESGNENGYSEEDSDEYSSEEFGSDFDSDDEIDPLDEPDHMNSSNKVLGFDNETPIRNRSPTDISIDDNFDFDPPSEKTHRSEVIEMREDEEMENDPEITANASVKTRSGRL